MNKISIFLFLIISVLSNSARAEPENKKVVWSCKTLLGQESILWLVEWGDQSYIKVFDERIPTTFKMSGLEKRWNWGLDENLTYTYAITLGADLYASYYDFSTSKDGTASSRERYKCSKS